MVLMMLFHDGGGGDDGDVGEDGCGDVSLNLPPPESYSTIQSAPQRSLENCNKFMLHSNCWA